MESHHDNFNLLQIFINPTGYFLYETLSMIDSVILQMPVRDNKYILKSSNRNNQMKSYYSKPAHPAILFSWANPKLNLQSIMLPLKSCKCLQNLYKLSLDVPTAETTNHTTSSNCTKVILLVKTRK